MFCIGRFTLTEDEVRKRKAYLQIAPQDEQRLREARPHLQAHAREIIDRFYDFLLSQEHTRAMLSAPGMLDRLKQFQTRYFDELTAGDYGVAYFENRLRVGLAHERTGLSPEWYLGAYSQYLQIVSDVLSHAFGGDHERFLQTMGALTKVIYLDMSLAIDAYIFSGEERLRQMAAARQQLTDMIVHDLQNPLSGIMAFLGHFEASGVSSSEREALQEAMRRCDDLSHMIMNVLQVSRAEEGKLETYIEDVDLAEVAREGVAAFRLVAEHGGRSLGVEAGAPVRVRTDRSLVRRMLYNLLRNALRHTPTGTRVAVRVEASPARLRVADDGPGIPREAHALLFERFGSAALREAGLRVDSGLGLAFCKAAAQAVGATIGLESDGRSGSAFTVTFP